MRTGLVSTVLAAALAVGLGGTTLALAADATTITPTTHRQIQLVKAPGFNAGGTWSIYQSNMLIATLKVTQDAQGNLAGTATNPGSGTTGTIEQGFVDGNYIYFVIPWSDGSRGRYIGSLQPDRRLGGVSTDLAHPTSQAAWNTDQTF
ncbi:hypothetical protein [Streptomyces sp. NPDC037389]|uniref:hypothetical protein n=1 Tax=Streptomyces sp. NPDC037389 TaxID=3155369 RepID=UPI0033FFA284